MKKYQKPSILVIELDAQSIIAQSAPSYTTTTFITNDQTEVQVTYDGINKMGIGDGGFLSGK